MSIWRHILVYEQCRGGERTQQQKYNILKRKLRDISNPLDMPNKDFVQRFRLSKEAFLFVLAKIHLSSGLRITYIPPVLRLAVTLIVLSSGGYQNTAGNDFTCPLSKSMVSIILQEILNKIESKLCPLFITTNANIQETKEWFYSKYGLPGVIGCIDGTHLFLLKPKLNEHMYFSRKHKHSLNVMIICNHQMEINGINARYGGAAHDTFVWEESQDRLFYESLYKQNRHCWLLGDSGYPIQPWLLTPYRSPSDDSEHNFNLIHGSARSIVERCIGLYKGVWRILLEVRTPRYAPEKLGKIANVCAALHNIAKKFKVQYADADRLIADALARNTQTGEGILQENIQYLEKSAIKKEGEKNRNNLKNMLI